MKVLHLPKKRQPTGSFDGGRIQERKPVNFPGSGDLVSAYSTVFYWAIAWGNEDGVITEHPHQGFEIMSYVLDGSLEHYDNLQGNWIALPEGSAQLMQAGSGLTHAERVRKGSRFFQIWLDPGLQNSLGRSPRYRDFHEGDFPRKTMPGYSVRRIVGKGSPMQPDTPVSIRDYEFSVGRHTLDLAAGNVLSVYIVAGEIDIDGLHAKTDDFIVLSDGEECSFEAGKPTRLFTIESPESPDYPVYSRLAKLRS